MRLFVDITRLARAGDEGTGIHRVTKEYLARFLRHPAPFSACIPLAGTGTGIASAAEAARRLVPDVSVPDLGLDAARAGDVVLVLDSFGWHTEAEWAAADAALARGVRFIPLIYDIFPLTHPDWFPDGFRVAASAWLRAIVARASTLFAISHATAAELARAAETGPLAPRPTVVVPLGSDPSIIRSDGPPPQALARLPLAEAAHERLLFLVVGTVEIRKAQADVLTAADALWAAGCDFALAVAGRRGWCSNGAEQRMAEHPEAGKRLFRLAELDDAALWEAYRLADCVVMASQDEGYGLPLVEAARLGRPVLARDRPVFREVAGDGALYFPDGGPEAIAQGLLAAMTLLAERRFPDPARVPRRSWEEAWRELRAKLIQAIEWEDTVHAV